MVEQLSEAERAEALDGLSDWDYDEARDAITRAFVFADFSEAFAFMSRVALLAGRSEEHTSELQSLMRISYAVFCLKKKRLDSQAVVLVPIRLSNQTRDIDHKLNRITTNNYSAQPTLPSHREK